MAYTCYWFNNISIVTGENTCFLVFILAQPAECEIIKERRQASCQAGPGGGKNDINSGNNEKNYINSGYNEKNDINSGNNEKNYINSGNNEKK